MTVIIKSPVTVARWWPLEVVVAERGVTREHLEDSVRVATRSAAWPT